MARLTTLVPWSRTFLARTVGKMRSAAQLPRSAYFPFSVGPRVCIGAGFAMMEATLLLASIAQRYQLRLVPDQRIEPLPSITLRPKNGIRVQIQARPLRR